jgi:hypothetical protein
VAELPEKLSTLTQKFEHANLERLNAIAMLGVVGILIKPATGLG